MKLGRSHLVVISVVCFLVFTVFASGRDYLIHHELYSFGLQADMSWIGQDWLIYWFELQLVAFVCAFLVKGYRVHLLVFYEFFINSSCQDLLFFGLWNKMSFPVDSWDWMYWAYLFGSWTTEQQIFLSGICLIVGALIAVLLPKKIGKWKLP